MRRGYKEEMGLENHVYSPAYRPQDMEELAQICDHIIFNSEKQLRTYLPYLRLPEPQSRTSHQP